MKNLLLLSVFLLVTAIYSCAPPKTATSGNVQHVSSKDGMITFNCVGTGSNKQEAISDAEINAFKILFFRGIPTSAYSAPMISVNEAEVLSKHKNYFNTLFSGKRYSSFVTASTIVTDFDKNKKLTLQISINTRSLRQDLVNSKVLSDYGF